MPKVHILSPDVISKIAAGEVIERPASVIKELIENSLDAQSNSIELRLKEAGKTSIILKDTGTGIEREDIETIFQRHSTSKINNIDDLFNIHSLGFRGEALYSIAAIADVILRSKAKTADSGWEIHMRGGEKLKLRPTSLSAGTEIEVKELFFNTPARRKFLKSNTTEINQVLNIFIPYTLLYPNHRFLLEHEDKTLLDLRPTTSFVDRSAEVLNLEKKNILEVTRDFPERNVRVHMLLGDINIVRSRRDMQFIFINNRPVQNKSISFHLNNVYRLILPPSNYPFFVLFLEIPPQEVDVNIHPTKREVKIREEQELCSLLRNLCEHTLMTSGEAKQAASYKAQDTGHKGMVEDALTETGRFEKNFSREIHEDIPMASAHQRPTEEYNFPQNDITALFPSLTQKKETLRDKLLASRYVGNFANKYLFFETAQSLLVLDQHAAQERITFEQLILQMEKGKVEVQHLLSPYIIKLSRQEMLVWEEAQEVLDSAGFSSTQFDEEAVAVHSYPVLLKDPQRAFQDILSGEDAARADHETIARRACRSSIMAGEPLNPQEADHIREKLLKCRDPFTCPHGRPTTLELSENFFNKQFLRS